MLNKRLKLSKNFASTEMCIYFNYNIHSETELQTPLPLLSPLISVDLKDVMNLSISVHPRLGDSQCKFIRISRQGLDDFLLNGFYLTNDFTVKIFD